MFSSSQAEEFNDFFETQVVKKICPGFDRHSIFLTHQGHVYTRGLNHHGQLGLGDTQDRYRRDGHLMPIRIRELENIIDIEAGTHHTLCLNGEGRVYAFGENTSGQLGSKDNKSWYEPTKLDLPPVKQINSLWNSSFFLTDEGEVFICGELVKEKLLTGKIDVAPYSIIKINIDPIVKFHIDHQLIFISRNNDIFVYFRSQKFSPWVSIASIGEEVDFLEYRLTVPDEIQKTLHYVYYHYPLFKCEKNSILERECHVRVNNMDNDLRLINILYYKMGADLAAYFAPYIKKVSQEVNNKTSEIVPTLKFLSALSFIKNHKRIAKLPEISGNMDNVNEDTKNHFCLKK